MKDNAYEIIGKTITGIIIKRNRHSRSPRSQLFLIFDDFSSYEFYSPDGEIVNTGGLNKNTSFREVYNYLGENTKVIFQAVADPDSGKVSFELHDS